MQIARKAVSTRTITVLSDVPAISSVQMVATAVKMKFVAMEVAREY